MADTPELGRRIEVYLEGRGDVTEVRILDGKGFFLDGHLVAAVMENDLCLRVGRERWESVLADRGVRPFLFAELPVPGWVLVDGSSIAAEDDLARWIESSIGRH